MPEYTLSEKIIIFQILTQIMKADCILNPAEIDFLDYVFKEFSLNIDEFDHIEEYDLDVLAQEFSKFSIGKKEYAKKLFIKMAECDGYVDPREMSIIDSIFRT